jgi:hypothetical protein
LIHFERALFTDLSVYWRRYKFLSLNPMYHQN